MQKIPEVTLNFSSGHSNSLTYIVMELWLKYLGLIEMNKLVFPREENTERVL